MDQQLKTRLIGATIIVSLVVIFVPMLFEDSSDRDAAGINTAEIPEFPQEFESQALPLPSAVPAPPSATALSRSEDEPVAAPAPAEPLDPLDVPSGDGDAGEAADPEEIGPSDPGALDAERPAAPARPPVAPPTKVQRLTGDVPSKPAAAEPKVVEKFKAAAAPAPARPKAVPSAKAATTAKTAPAPAPTPEPKKAPAGKLAAWVVQAGSFSEEANAKALMHRLRQAKIAAFVEMVPGAGGNSYRVRIGPELDRARAEAILKKMESEAGVKGMIVSYP